jgi:hypothetical protein
LTFEERDARLGRRPLQRQEKEKLRTDLKVGHSKDLEVPAGRVRRASRRRALHNVAPLVTIADGNER